MEDFNCKILKIRLLFKGIAQQFLKKNVYRVVLEIIPFLGGSKTELSQERH